MKIKDQFEIDGEIFFYMEFCRLKCKPTTSRKDLAKAGFRWSSHTFIKRNGYSFIVGKYNNEFIEKNKHLFAVNRDMSLQNTRQGRLFNSNQI